MNTEHLYPGIPEARLSLRSDSRIRAFESAAKHNEPQRADKAHVLKAAGSSSGQRTFISDLSLRTDLLTLLPPLFRHLHPRGAQGVLPMVPSVPKGPSECVHPDSGSSEHPSVWS